MVRKKPNLHLHFFSSVNDFFYYTAGKDSLTTEEHAAGWEYTGG